MVKRLFLKVFQSGHLLTFAGRALNEVVNESWKVPSRNLYNRRIMGAQCTMRIVPRQLQVFEPSFTKKSSMSKLTECLIDYFLV